MDNPLAVIVLLLISFLGGGLSYMHQDIDSNLDINDFRKASLILKEDCEKDLSRSKKCILDFKFVVEK